MAGLHVVVDRAGEHLVAAAHAEDRTARVRPPSSRVSTRDCATWGTLWHGTLENDAFRRAWLTRVAAQAGRDWTPASGHPGHADRREAMIERLADAVEEHLDLDTLLAWARAGATTGGPA